MNLLRGLDVQIPFFNEMWRRVGITTALLAWTGVEIAQGSVFWAMLFGGLGLWCAYSFFVVWKGPHADAEK